MMYSVLESIIVEVDIVSLSKYLLVLGRPFDSENNFVQPICKTRRSSIVFLSRQLRPENQEYLSYWMCFTKRCILSLIPSCERRTMLELKGICFHRLQHSFQPQLREIDKHAPLIRIIVLAKGFHSRRDIITGV